MPRNAFEKLRKLDPQKLKDLEPPTLEALLVKSNYKDWRNNVIKTLIQDHQFTYKELCTLTSLNWNTIWQIINH